MIYIELKNQRQFMNALNRIPDQFQPRLVHKIYRYAAKPMLKFAKGKAPISSAPHEFSSGGQKYTIMPGNLSDSIKLWPLKKSKFAGMIMGAKVKGRPVNKAGFYAHFVEYGGGTVKQHRSGKYKRKKGTRTGPAEGKPFMRPAWDLYHNEVERRFMQVAIKKIDQEWKRLSKKGLV